MATMSADATGLTLAVSSLDGAKVAVAWKAIRRIVAFKQDLFNPLIVRVVITTDDDEIELAEADCGTYRDLTRLLTEHLDAIVPYDIWWPEVIDPVTKHEEIGIFTDPD